VGRGGPAGLDRDAQGAVQGPNPRSSLGALSRLRAAVPAAGPLLALILFQTAAAQPEAGQAVQLTGLAGALRLDADFALDAEAQWAAMAGIRAGWRPTPQVTLSGEALFGSFDRITEDGSLRALGVFATLRPWIGREWPADLAFDFGLESVDGGDDEDRGPALVFGLGVERTVGRRGMVEAGARHHFLTVHEEEVDGIATGRDAELWEVRAGVSLLLGGSR
jgi:hypothetical protein